METPPHHSGLKRPLHEADDKILKKIKEEDEGDDDDEKEITFLVSYMLVISSFVHL